MKILVSDDVSMKGVELLRENGYEVDVKKNLDEQGLIDCIGEYDGLITRSMTHVTEKVIEAATKLKVVGRAGVGVDSIDLKSATSRGIVVVNTPTSNTLAATEHTCAMIMAITRHIPQAHNSLMAGNWDRKTFTGIQLQNKTIGIIGVGRIGSRIAKRMQAMEMKTIGYDPYIPEERFKQLGVEQVDLDTLLKRSDYITMHTPLTKETRGLIGKEEIAKMKDGVRVINVSRGAVLDIYALAEALKSGHVAGAAIDVFPTEPLTKDINPFLGMDNVVITPHLGASTVEAQIGVSIDVAEGVMEALKGEPVATAVNMAPVPPNVYIFPMVAHSVITTLPVGTDEIVVPAKAGVAEQQIFSLFGYKDPVVDANWCRIMNKQNGLTVDTLKIGYDALPAGMESRTANITLTDGYDTITLKVTQKADQKKYDVTDVTRLINMILGTVEKDDAYDFDGDGILNVTDVTSLINIILQTAQ